MILKNEDIIGLRAEIPEGHRHIRTTLQLADGTEITLQEASVAAIVRSYIGIKTDPKRRRIVMKGMSLDDRKRGYARWQLIEQGGDSADGR